MKGKYALHIPIGIHNVTTSKGRYIPQTINVEVLKDQTSILNFELKGGDNMEHIIDINITNCEDETIEVPDGCSQKRYKFAGTISGDSYIGKNVELLSADGNTILQTTTTDADGFATFTDAIYGNYKLKITY